MPYFLEAFTISEINIRLANLKSIQEHIAENIKSIKNISGNVFGGRIYFFKKPGFINKFMVKGFHDFLKVFFKEFKIYNKTDFNQPNKHV